MNDPVAIRRCMDEPPLLASINVALGVGVARHVEPVTAPAFAIAGAGEQAIDELGNGGLAIPGRCFDELFHFGGCRRKSGEIETHPANQCPCISGLSGSQPGGFQFRQDEPVDVRLHPARVLHRGRRENTWRVKGPVLMRIRRRHGCSTRSRREQPEQQGERPNEARLSQPSVNQKQGNWP